MAEDKTLCTKGFALRALETAMACIGMIVMLTAVGNSTCTETTAGPGSEVCKTEMPFTIFPSCVYYVVISAFTIAWCFTLILSHLFTHKAQPVFCQKYGECIEYVSDFLLAILNLVAYITMAIELNQAKANDNQGKTVMQLSSDAPKYAVSMAFAFILFIFFTISLAHNLKLATRQDDLQPSQELPVVATKQAAVDRI
jgi:hypothetical protein